MIEDFSEIKPSRVFISHLVICYISFFFRPVKIVKLITEDTIEEAIYSIAQEKLQLEQDLTASGESDNPKKVKKDVSRLLKLALDVEMNEKQLGDVGKVYTEL